MKPIIFLGTSRADLRSFPEEARQDLGQALAAVQFGRSPADWKPMPSVGAGVRELRARTATGAFRTIYTAQYAGAVYVLHAFQKRSQKTAKRDLDLAKTRFAGIPKGSTP